MSSSYSHWSARFSARRECRQNVQLSRDFDASWQMRLRASKIQPSVGSTDQANARRPDRLRDLVLVPFLKRHFLSRAARDAHFLSREKIVPTSRSSSLSAICALFLPTRASLCLFFSLSFFYRLSNYKLYWQLTTSPKLVRSFHGEASNNVT